MKIEIERGVLQGLLKAVAGAVATRTTIPALKCYHLAAGDGLTLSATDGTLHSSATTTDVKVGRAGMVLIDAALLNEAAKLAPDGPISIVSEAKGTTIKYAGGSYKVPAHELDHFPARSEPQTPPDEFDVVAGDLVRLMDRVSFAATKKDGASDKYATTGIQMEAEGYVLTLAATDTVRLAVATGRLPAAVAKCEGLLPLAVAGAVRGTFGDRDEVVRVSLWKTAVKVASGRATTLGPLLSGKFPSWRVYMEKIVSKASVLTDHPADLLAAVRRASVTADDTNTALDVRAEGEALCLSLCGKAGEGEVEHVAAGHAGDERTLTTRLYPDHLKEWLGAAAAAGIETVEFAPGDGKKAAWLGAGAEWQYLTMPMVPS